MTRPLDTPGLGGLLRVHRGIVVAVAVIGIVLGILGLVFPGAVLITVGLLFGSYLVVSGVFRIVSAFTGERLSTGMRWFSGILGVLILVAGVLCLANPFRSLFAIAFLIGIGWVAEGIVDIASAVQGTVQPRWYGWVSGVVAVLAGIATFLLPGLSLTLFVTVASILLIVVSISTLLMLPRRARVD